MPLGISLNGANMDGTSQRRIRPRSRHLRVIPFAGSRSSNPTKIGVWLWIDSSLYRALIGHRE
jgi:hypothetical protein